MKWFHLYEILGYANIIYEKKLRTAVAGQGLTEGHGKIFWGNAVFYVLIKVGIAQAYVDVKSHRMCTSNI